MQPLSVRSTLSGRLTAILLAALVVGGLGQAASACSTPVYRYAMYNWATSPFFVFYFHHGAPAAEDRAVNAKIEALTTDWPPQANVSLESIDTTDSAVLEKLPKSVVEAWKSEQGGGLPVHMVFTPWGTKLFAGRLDENTLARMLDSPARQKIGHLLAEGNAAVMVFIPGKEEEQNQRVEKALGELKAMVATGKIPVAGGFADPAFAGVIPPDAGEDNGDDTQPESDRLRIATLKVDRGDPKEAWLVKTLMAVEPDLHEYEDEPMVFAAYGRGRALEPYIGKGITSDNLVDCVAFLSGPCSCMVKEQNPGADLLFKWDWEATADALAADDPAMNADPSTYQEFAVGQSPAEQGSSPADAGREDAGAQPPSTDLAQATVEKAAEPGSEPAGSQPPVKSAEAESGGESTEATLPPPSKPAHLPLEVAVAGKPVAAADPGSFASRQMLLFGVGFVALAAVVALAGLFLMGRR